MSPRVPPAPSIVDVDAEVVFRHPLAIVLVVTFVVGALDAVGFQQYGVFTANQAGNLVIVWTLLAATPAAAGLALASLVGCALGVTAVILVRRAWSWLVTAAGSRLMLVAAAVLIFVAQRLGSSLSTSATREPGSRDRDCGLVVGGRVDLAHRLLHRGARHGVHQRWGSARADPRVHQRLRRRHPVRRRRGGHHSDRSEWWAHARVAAGFPIAWTAGAAAAALLPVEPLGIVVGAAALVAVIGLFARRVSGADLSSPPTV